MTTSIFPKTPKILATALLATTCFATMWAQTPAMAQSNQDSAELEEITVTGIRGSLESAALIKRNADQPKGRGMRPPVS